MIKPSALGTPGVISLLMVLLFISCSDQASRKPSAIKELPLPEPKSGITYASSDQFEENVLQWNTSKAGQYIDFNVSGGQLEGYDYIICELYHEAPYSLIVEYVFYDEKAEKGAIQRQGEGNTQTDLGEPRLSVKIGALPKLKTNIVFPLSYLDGQEIFIERSPRQLKGTVSGRRIKKGDVKTVAVNIKPHQAPDFLPNLEIGRVYLSKEKPEPLPPPERPVVDEFGQWAIRDFKGKIESEDALVEQIKSLEAIAENAQFPDSWSRYGGWKEKRYGATGFFRLEKDGEKWWMVDPDGCAFVSVGVDCVRPHSSGVVEGQEDLFKWLPENSGLYAECYSKSWDKTMFDFFKSNLIRVYGEEWRSKWEKITAGMLKAYGVNTIGNWSDYSFIKQAELAYVYPLQDFPSTSVKLYRDFPDVFSDEYLQGAIQFASQLDSLKDDPYMIGYFLRNEPHWAFGSNDIAFEMFAEPVVTDSKKKFINWIQEKYPTIDKLNTSWQVSLSSYEDLLKSIFEAYPSPQAKKDFWDFSRILVRKYVDVVCDEVEKVDNNHLNLGMRYAWISSDLLYEAGERFDVFSINGYRVPLPPLTEEVYEKSGKPVMIGEFHFGAIDGGLPSTGITGVASQEDRAKAYQSYVENGLERDELIGVHFFQWLDQPVFGRFDGENYNIGVVSITGMPYEDKVSGMKQTNLNIYQVASGTIPPFREPVEVIPAIHF